MKSESDPALYKQDMEDCLWKRMPKMASCFPLARSGQSRRTPEFDEFTGEPLNNAASNLRTNE
jgi:hypothetical protein